MEGKRLWVFFKTIPYDVVVLDLKMPGMNGIDTLKKMKEMGVIRPDHHADRSRGAGFRHGSREIGCL